MQKSTEFQNLAHLFVPRRYKVVLQLFASFCVNVITIADMHIHTLTHIYTHTVYKFMKGLSGQRVPSGRTVVNNFRGVTAPEQELVQLEIPSMTPDVMPHLKPRA